MCFFTVHVCGLYISLNNLYGVIYFIYYNYFKSLFSNRHNLQTQIQNVTKEKESFVIWLSMKQGRHKQMLCFYSEDNLQEAAFLTCSLTQF